MTETTITDGIVWPEDKGTGAPVEADNGDWTSAGHLGTAIGARGRGSYVAAGLDISYNPSNTTIDISGGLAFIRYAGLIDVQSTTQAYDTAWDHPMLFVVSVPSVSNLSLDASAANDVYIALDPTATDSVRYRYGSSVSAPSDPHIALATVDTGAGTVAQTAREPDLSVGELTASGPATFSNGINLDGGTITSVEYQEIEPEGNDFFQLRDGSGGSNTSAYTFRYDTRGMRFWAGSGFGEVFKLAQDGTATFAGEVSIPTLTGDITEGTALSTLTGSNLSIDTNGTLNATDTNDDTRADVSDSGTTVVEDTTGINFASGFDVAGDGDGSVTVNTSTQTGGDSATYYMSDYTTPDDGTADDAAFDSAVSDASPGETIVFDHGNYLLTSSHTVTKQLDIVGLDATIEYTNTANNDAAIHFQGTGITNTTTTMQAHSPSTREIAVDDTAAFSEGDYILLIDGTYSYNVDAPMQFHRVTSAGAGTILLDGGLHTGFPSGAEVNRVELLDSPTMRGLETHGGGVRHLQFQWCVTPTFEDCSVSECLEVSLLTVNCFKPRYYNVEARQPTGKASGEGEQLASYRCSDVYIESPRIDECRRGIDLAWGTHNATIIDPVIRGVSLVGIGVHQDNYSGKVTIEGGEVVCDPGGQSGHCISMSSTATVDISGTRLVARNNGLLCQGELHASDITIESTTATIQGYAINVKSSNVTIENCQIDDPDGIFEYAIWIDGAGGVENISIDADTNRAGDYHLYIEALTSSDSVEHVDISGTYRCRGYGANEVGMIDARSSALINDIDLSLNVYNTGDQALRIYQENATVQNVNIHDSYFDTGKACVYTDGTDGFGPISVDNCRCVSASGYPSLSFNEGVNGLAVTGNIVNGSIDSSGDSSAVVANNREV